MLQQRYFPFQVGLHGFHATQPLRCVKLISCYFHHPCPKSCCIGLQGAQEHACLSKVPQSFFPLFIQACLDFTEKLVNRIIYSTSLPLLESRQLLFISSIQELCFRVSSIICCHEC